MTPPTARRPQTPHRHDSRRRLPATLDQASLAAAWGEGGASAGGLKARTVIALWQPRDDEIARLVEDTTGQGHITREIEAPRKSLFIPLPASFDASAWKL